MTTKRKVGLAAAATVLVTSVAVALIVRAGLPIYNVPTMYRSTGCVASNQCAQCVANPLLWTDGNALTPSLTSVVRGLAAGTIVTFATDGCYEINGGINQVQSTAPISYEGNPLGTPGQNAELYNACQNHTAGTDCHGTDQNGNIVGPPVLTEQFPMNPSNNVPITIEDLQIQGNNHSGNYPASDQPMAYASGILLNGTAGTFINDVSVDNTYGDCLTVNPDVQHFQVRTTNLVVENFSGAEHNIPGNTPGCGRDSVSFESVNGATFCGTSFGPPGEPESWNWEDDSEGANMGSINVLVTGRPCNFNGIPASGCTFVGFVQVNSNVARTGNIRMNDCQQTAVSPRSNSSGTAIKVVPEGSNSGTLPAGNFRFTNDTFKCFSSSSACTVVQGPFTLSVSSSVFTLGSSVSNTQRAFDVTNNTIGGTVYGANLYLSTDCFAGFISNLSSPPYGGVVGSASTYTPVNTPYPPPMGSLTGFFNGSKALCSAVP